MGVGVSVSKNDEWMFRDIRRIFCSALCSERDLETSWPSYRDALAQCESAIGTKIADLDLTTARSRKGFGAGWGAERETVIPTWDQTCPIIHKTASPHIHPPRTVAKIFQKPSLVKMGLF